MNPVLRVVGLACLAVLAGCSTPPQTDDHVASLETTGSAPSVTVSSTSPAASRPRERLDMTVDEVNELYEAYGECLSAHGLPKGKPSGGDGGGPVQDSRPDTGNEAAAEAACVSQEPLPPWEYDTSNPESADFVHGVVQCLRAKGVKYVDEEPPTPGENRRAISFGGPNNDSDSISKGLNLVGSCEKEQAHR
jgi:hypothetical protein